MSILHFLLILFAYLFGSIPWGLILVKQFAARDVRDSGSGNIGATNVRRVAGTGLGIATLAGDVAKGFLPVYLAILLEAARPAGGDLFVGTVGICAFLGHLFPLYLKGRGGGKGVATGAGAFAAISPAAVGVALLVFILFVCISSRASVGSMAGGAVMPLGIWEATGSGIYAGCAGLVSVLILFRHYGNIRRLLSGKEPRI